MDAFKREVARRIFAYEFNDSYHKIGGNKEREPVYVLTPTGMRCNRVFIVGALLEKEETMPDSNIWRIRISDPTGVFVGFVGKYQPEALETILEVEPPELVSVVGKIRVYEGETRNFTTLRPECITVVDRDVRGYWILETAKLTLERIKQMEKRNNADINLAWQIYNPDLDEFIEVVRKAVNSVIEYDIEADKFSTKRVIKKGDEVEEMEKEEKKKEEIDETEEIEEFEDLDDFELDFEVEEWDLSDILDE